MHENGQNRDNMTEPPGGSSSETAGSFDPSPYMRQLRSRSGAEDYLDVKHRLLWLRREHPDAEILTEHIRIDQETAIFRATVTIPDGGRATGHGSETALDFVDYIEKAETKALGRALNALGYGAQFIPQDEEAEQPPERTSRPPASAKGRDDEAVPHDGGDDTAPRQNAAPAALSPEPRALPIEDYSWTAFWKWARDKGFDTKDQIESFIDGSTGGMSPGEVRRAILAKQGNVP
jgi:hypothetical protein